MRAVFADIDGVFHPSTAIEGLCISAMATAPQPAIDKHDLFRWTNNLEDILSHNDDIMLVLHSTWRKQSWATNGFFRNALGPLAHRFVGITPVDLEREESITATVRRYEITDYLIIDDAVGEFSLRHDTPHLIVTNPLLGISESAVLEKIKAWAHISAHACTQTNRA